MITAISHRERSREARLFMLLLRREQRSPLLLAALAAVPAAAASLGLYLQSRGLASIAQLPDPEVLGATTYLLASIGRGLVVPFTFVAIYLVADRIAADHAAGWLAPLASTGVARAVYPPAILAGVLIVVVPLAAFASIAYAAGVTAGGGNRVARDAVAAAIAALPGQCALLLAATAYGTACAALVRRRGPAILLAFAGLALPVAVLTTAERLTGSRQSQFVTRAVSIHIPRPTIANTPRAITEHAAYAFVVVLLLSACANRLVARQR